MKKVVYSLTRFKKHENQRRKGVGYITDEDLSILDLQDYFRNKHTGSIH